MAVFVMLRRRRSLPRSVPPLAGRRFGQGYWLVVAVEVVAIAVGLALFNGPLHTPRAAVAWISFVVGAHFFGLAAIWKQSPGRPGALLRPAPLRIGRARFRASGSSKPQRLPGRAEAPPATP